MPHIFFGWIAKLISRDDARGPVIGPAPFAWTRWRFAPAVTNGLTKEAGMTAYLISLALAGLVTIALWEAVS
jgi:hypothetical protein